MDTMALTRALARLLIPFLPALLADKTDKIRDAATPPMVRALWKRLVSDRREDDAQNALFYRLAAEPYQPNLQASLDNHLQGLLSADPGLARSLEAILSGTPSGMWLDRSLREKVFRGSEKMLDRLEMIYLVRTGMNAAHVAQRFGVSSEDVYALNARFCAAGIVGLMTDEAESRYCGLAGGDPILGRLEMLHLLHCGTPVDVIAEQYKTEPEYVERLVQKLKAEGVPGILADKDVEHILALYPFSIRISSYNLHGPHMDNGTRLRRIAAQIAGAEPHIAVFQEAVSEDGEDTSTRIARTISSMTGNTYRSEFLYCHQYMEKYPEGISVATRFHTKGTTVIDLTELPGGLRPTLARKALVMELESRGRIVLATSVHLEHGADGRVRVAQAEKLVRELEARAQDTHHCSILAGDFNDDEGSQAIACIKSAGYRDAYRECNSGHGNTYPAGNPLTRLDYIFVKGNVSVVASGVLLDDPELSDHVGVFAEIR